MRNEILLSTIKKIESGFYKISHKYENYIEISEKNEKQILSDISINSENIDDFNFKSGLRGYLLLEYIRINNSEVTIKYNQILKPSDKSFDYPLLSYFTKDELELIDYRFYGRKLYKIDQNSFNILIEGLNYILNFCNMVLIDEKINKIKEINDIHEYLKLIKENILSLTSGNVRDYLYRYVNLKKDISIKSFDKLLGISILQDMMK